MRIVQGSQNHTAGRERTGGDRSQDSVRASADDASLCKSEEPNAAGTQQDSLTWRVPMSLQKVF